MRPLNRASPCASVTAFARERPLASYSVIRVPLRGLPSFTPVTHTAASVRPTRAWIARSVICTRASGCQRSRVVSTRGLEMRISCSVPAPGRAVLAAASRTPVTRGTSALSTTPSRRTDAVVRSAAQRSGHAPGAVSARASSDSGRDAIVMSRESTLTCCTARVRGPSRSTSMRPYW